MRTLVTGHRGNVGPWLVAALEAAGHQVVGFDLADGDDLLDADAVARAAARCDAIVHAGALAHDRAGSPERIMAVNVLGTWHVLLAAQAAGASLVVHFSSGQALGIAGGERLPDYFPVDDHHPRRASRPYGLSKRLSEDLCAAFSEGTGIGTVSLRPVWVWLPDTYREVAERHRREPRSEWEPFWEYGAFVDVRDVARAVTLALAARPVGHHRLLLCAGEICGSAPSLELAGRLAPGVPIRDPERFATDRSRALFDCSAAAAAIGWQPQHGLSGGP